MDGRRAGASFAALPALDLTYAEVGATAEPRLPVGYWGVERSVFLGFGSGVLDRAGIALAAWRMHRWAGVRVAATGLTAVAGAEVLLTVGRWPLALTAPCRVVYVVEEEDRRGFAYGTLTGHPESGEESFTVELGADGQVIFRIRAFSRAATTLARVGGPLTRMAQDLALARYLRAMEHLARPQ